MSIPVRSLRLLPKPKSELDRLSGNKGEIFYDSTSKSLRIFDGAILGGTLLNASVTVAETPPTTPNQGSLWFNSANGSLYIYYQDINSNQWVTPIVPAGLIGSGGSGGVNSGIAGLSDASAAGLTVDKIYLPAITRLDVTANGSTAYLFDQYAGNNPTIYAISGTTIAFDLSVGLSNHPFLIRFSGANYNTGLTHVTTTGIVTTGASAQGKTSGTLYWKIPAGISGAYGYLCSNHGSMIGTITIKDISVI